LRRRLLFAPALMRPLVGSEKHATAVVAVGLDISKPAGSGKRQTVKNNAMAGRSQRQIYRWARRVFGLHLVFRVFVYPEFRRVLRPGGRVRLSTRGGIIAANCEKSFTRYSRPRGREQTIYPAARAQHPPELGYTGNPTRLKMQPKDPSASGYWRCWRTSPSHCFDLFLPLSRTAGFEISSLTSDNCCSCSELDKHASSLAANNSLRRNRHPNRRKGLLVPGGLAPGPAPTVFNCFRDRLHNRSGLSADSAGHLKKRSWRAAPFLYCHQGPVTAVLHWQ